MKTALIAFVVLMTTSIARADETVTLAPSQQETTRVLQAPGPGENLIITVEIPEEAPAPAPVPKVVYRGSRLVLRGGPSIGGSYVSGGESSYTGGVVGQLGRKKSSWQLQADFRLGSCADDRLAIEGGLAVMHMAVRHFRFGLGMDLLYCSDTQARPMEQAVERVVSASVKMAYEFGPLALEASIGVGQKTEPTPGSRHTEDVGIVGLSVSYLFGK